MSTDLETWSRAEAMLAQIATAVDAVQVIDIAEAARVWAEKAGLGVKMENHATAIKMLAEIKLADAVDAAKDANKLRKPGRPPGSGRRKKLAPPEGQLPPDVEPGAAKPVPAKLTDLLGIENEKTAKKRVSEARRIKAKYTPEKIRAIAAEATDKGETISRKQLLNGQSVQQSQTNEWYTPSRYLAAARRVLGAIDLDPASNPQANQTVKAATFFTEQDDGLGHEWSGRVWLNPPYGRLAGDFVERLVKEHEAGNVTAAITLVNAHCTDTKWFQGLWDHTLCFTDHRIDFEAGTVGRSGSTHGSVFAYLGPDPAVFAKHFTEFGAVVRRYP